jgi:predicted PurR-regulated permease PerM
VISLLIISPIVAFYLLVDWPKIFSTLESWVPPKGRATMVTLVRDMDRALGGFIRGQASVCAIMAAWYGLTLSLIGLSSGLVLGVITGLMTFIPYIGSLSGLVIAMVIAAVQFWPTSTPLILIAGAFLLGQFFENYVLAPKLVGEAVGLHAVWLMFALVAFGYLFGFVGVLVAVPVSAILAVLIRFVLQAYLNGPFYRGAL